MYLPHNTDVSTCSSPKAREPIRIASVSVRGVKSAGRAVKVVSGRISFARRGRKSPRKLPVSAPITNVLIPHRIKSPAICSIVPLGRSFLRIKMPPASMRSP